jgi:hypothetical protein
MAVAAESIFGRIVSGADVEDWCMALVKKWAGTYISEVERQRGITAGTLARFRGFEVAPSYDKWPEDQLPAVILVSVGLVDPPVKSGDGRYRARWMMGVGCIASARTQADAHQQGILYLTAMRELFIQRPSLDGHADGTRWLGEDYTQLAYDDIRTLGAGLGQFSVEVDGVASADAGPTTPDLPLDPDTLPWPPWQEVETVEIEVENYPPYGDMWPAPAGPPTGPPPVLTQLDPDFAGDWNAEVRALGENFTPDSKVVSGDVVVEGTVFVSPTELRFVVPGVVAAGVYQVKVRTGSQESAALPFTAL